MKLYKCGEGQSPARLPGFEPGYAGVKVLRLNRLAIAHHFFRRSSWLIWQRIICAIFSLFCPIPCPCLHNSQARISPQYWHSSLICLLPIFILFLFQFNIFFQVPISFFDVFQSILPIMSIQILESIADAEIFHCIDSLRL